MNNILYTPYAKRRPEPHRHVDQQTGSPSSGNDMVTAVMMWQAIACAFIFAVSVPVYLLCPWFGRS